MVLLASGGLRPGVLLSILQHRGEPLATDSVWSRAWETLVYMLGEFTHVSLNSQLLKMFKYYFHP